MHFAAAIFAAILSLFHTTFALPHTVAAEAQPVTIIFGGDMMFDRTVRTTIDEKGGNFIFSCIDSALAPADLVVANLEGPITPNASKSTGSAVGSDDNYVFTFATSTAPLLAVHHIGIVNLGNNHIMNFGAAGVRSTVAALSSAGVQSFGDPISFGVATTTIHGIPLAFINYNQFAPSISGGQSTAARTIEQIQVARLAGEIPIVYTHWGIEYEGTAPASVHTLAHKFVDAGAALIIGSHPHVVEESEVYKGVPIYYSLGNFIFDQYFSDAVDHGLLLSVTLDAKRIEATKEIPISIGHDRRPCPVY